MIFKVVSKGITLYNLLELNQEHIKKRKEI